MRLLLLEVLNSSWGRLEGARVYPATSQHLGVEREAHEAQASLRPAMTPGDSRYELMSPVFRHKAHFTSQAPEIAPKDMLFVLPSSIPSPHEPHRYLCSDPLSPFAETAAPILCTCLQAWAHWQLLGSVIMNVLFTLNSEPGAMSVAASTHWVCAVCQVRSI